MSEESTTVTRGTVVSVPFPVSETKDKKFDFRVLGKTSRGWVRGTWMAGPLKGREALLMNLKGEVSYGRTQEEDREKRRKRKERKRRGEARHRQRVLAGELD